MLNKTTIREIKLIKDPQDQIDFVVDKYWFVNIFQTMDFFDRYWYFFPKANILLIGNFEIRHKQNCKFSNDSL